jgi:RHS repeat-associated protein
MHLVMGDHLGSSSVVINHATGELVERTTYQPYGAVESDYRPSKWEAFREPHKFTGKEEDIEVGATYFGARYYQPRLGRFMSADPLTIHGLGSDLNPYAYVGGRVMSAVDPFGLCTQGAVVKDPNGTTTEVTDCPPQNNQGHADAQAARGEAMATTRQMTSFVRERPDTTQSWIPTPPETFEIVHGSDQSSGGGVPSITPHTITYRSTNRELLAKQYPALAPRIHAAETEDVFLKYVHLLLLLIPGAQGEGALGSALRGGAAAGEGAMLGEAGASAADFAWGARMTPAAIESNVTPRLTMADGYALGNDLGSAGQVLTLGKYPGNVQFVRANPWSYTVDRPWGWTPSYNAGAVRGHLDAGGAIHLTSETFTGTYKLEMDQVLNSVLW